MCWWALPNLSTKPCSELPRVQGLLGLLQAPLELTFLPVPGPCFGKLASCLVTLAWAATSSRQAGAKPGGVRVAVVPRQP